MIDHVSGEENMDGLCNRDWDDLVLCIVSIIVHHCENLSEKFFLEYLVENANSLKNS